MTPRAETAVKLLHFMVLKRLYMYNSVLLAFLDMQDLILPNIGHLSGMTIPIYFHTFVEIKALITRS